MQHSPPGESQLLYTRADLKRLGIIVSNTSLLRWESVGRFPRRIRMAGTSVAWIAAEVTAWLAARAEERAARITPTPSEPPPIERNTEMRERFSLTTQMRSHDLLIAALAYADAGLKVLATWGIDAEGDCECRHRRCKRKGKHPIGEFFPEGFRDATTDAVVLRKIWKKYPNANVAIVPDNELFVIDIDGQAGQATIDALSFPETVTAKTARGVHLYFTTMSRRRLRKLPQVDCRHDGNGYVMAPPSKHSSGIRYRWMRGSRSAAVVIVPKRAIVGHMRSRAVSLGSLDEPTKAWRSVYLRYRQKLHKRVQFLIDYDQAAGFERDQSKCVFEIVAGLRRAGASTDEIAAILWSNPYFLGKWGKGLPDLHAELWRIPPKLGDSQ